MSVLRIYKKQQNFLILDKTCLNDKKLSWAAKGLHAYLMSLPDDWRVRVSDLKDRAKNGRDAVRNLLKELEQACYIKKTFCRNETNGRFGGFEFLVLEIPELKYESEIEDLDPEAEKASPVNLSTQNTTAGNPSLDCPETEKATLISIEYTNYPENKIIKKTAAAKEYQDLDEDLFHDEKVAAVFFNKNKIPTQIPSISLSAQDAVIGKILTPNQLERIQLLVKKLPVSPGVDLISEIKYCLLSPKQFKACGQDFAHKLNAIRTVILREDWQTPVGLALNLKEKANAPLHALESELCKARAEATHFQKLLAKATGYAHEQLGIVLKNTGTKIKDLEERIYLAGCVEEKACL